VAFLGGTIGNLLPAERSAFLHAMRSALERGDWLLLGTDLVKDPGVLIPAYDDAAGVTAEFNRNVLRVLNRELQANFEVESFDHVAVWDADRRWIEMRLRARRPMRVRVLDLDLVFAAGEELRTEISAKFRPADVDAELGAAGFAVQARWTDGDGLFAVTLAQAV
jgi:L-histidine N-alpha-methyltransferase